MAATNDVVRKALVRAEAVAEAAVRWYALLGDEDDPDAAAEAEDALRMEVVGYLQTMPVGEDAAALRAALVQPEVA